MLCVRSRSAPSDWLGSMAYRLRKTQMPTWPARTLYLSLPSSSLHDITKWGWKWSSEFNGSLPFSTTRGYVLCPLVKTSWENIQTHIWTVFLDKCSLHLSIRRWIKFRPDSHHNASSSWVLAVVKYSQFPAVALTSLIFLHTYSLPDWFGYSLTFLWPRINRFYTLL